MSASTEGWATPSHQFRAHYFRHLHSLCGEVHLPQPPACGYRPAQTRNNVCRKCRETLTNEARGAQK